MIPIGFIGLFLLFLFYKIKIHDNPVNVKYFLMGLFLPSIDFFLNVFLSLDYSFSSSLFTIPKSIYLFHSIFMILLFILLNNILAIIYKRGSSQKDTISILFGFLFYLILEVLFTSNNVYIFWPIMDYELKIQGLSLLPYIDISTYKILIILITIEIFSHFLISKLLCNILLEDNLKSEKFLIVYLWNKTLKKLNILFITMGFLFMVGFLSNKNILLFIYMLFYTLSTARYLSVTLKLNLGNQIARSH